MFTPGELQKKFNLGWFLKHFNKVKPILKPWSSTEVQAREPLNTRIDERRLINPWYKAVKLIVSWPRETPKEFFSKPSHPHGPMFCAEDLSME